MSDCASAARIERSVLRPHSSLCVLCGCCVHSQKWRKDAGIDNVLANPPTELRRVLSAIVPEAFHKFDRHGLPAYWMKVTTPTTHTVEEAEEGSTAPTAAVQCGLLFVLTD